MTPTIGRIVKYKVDLFHARQFNCRGDGAVVIPGEDLPALITKVLDVNAGTVNLRVFRDGLTDAWVTNVPFTDITAGNGAKSGTWFWPARN